MEVGFNQTLYSVREGEGSVEIVMTKSGSNARSVGVAFTTKDNTATSKEIQVVMHLCMCGLISCNGHILHKIVSKNATSMATKDTLNNYSTENVYHN